MPYHNLLAKRLRSNQTLNLTPQKQYDHLATEILRATADLDLLKTISPSPGRKKMAPWFNQHCHSLNKAVYSLLIKLNTSYSPSNRLAYITGKKNLANAYRLTQKQYFTTWSLQLAQAKTSQAFWKLIGKFSPIPSFNNPSIKSTTWYKYLKNIYKISNASKPDYLFNKYIKKITTTSHAHNVKSTLVKISIKEIYANPSALLKLVRLQERA